MSWISTLSTVLNILVGLAVVGLLIRTFGRKSGSQDTALHPIIETHFRPATASSLTISERQFPFRVRADLQQAIDRLFEKSTTICHFCGVSKSYSNEGLSFGSLLLKDNWPAVSLPPQYEEVDIGEESSIRCLKNGLWLLREGDLRFAVLLAPTVQYGQSTGVKFEVAVVNSPEGTRMTERFFLHLEKSVLKSESYRGKVLSLEIKDRYSGTASGIMVHKLKEVDKSQVILPRQTIELLERNVINFVRQRSQLRAVKQSTKKGLLFYGLPGTGKTHTIHYLAKALEGHTILLISAEQVGLLEDYMVIARLLQPSMVVLEDVDLIARERTQMNTPCEEILLNKLLNEMDGLGEDADILFILTTNRPESLERALASRPGRIDQAIEFPLPDDEGREKLIRLYSKGVDVSPEVAQSIIKRTDEVSPAFIKELMRRATQFHLERSDSRVIELLDVERALEEMIFSGGSLNLKLLGGDGAKGSAACS